MSLGGRERTKWRTPSGGNLDPSWTIVPPRVVDPRRFHCHNLRHEDHEMMRSFAVNRTDGLHAKDSTQKLQMMTFADGEPWTALRNCARARPSTRTHPNAALSSRAESTTSGTKVLYDKYQDPTYKDCVAVDRVIAEAKRPFDDDYGLKYLERGIYRIFYPRDK